ncbi:MAG: hypothetical protein JXB60_05655 [Candidatus Cloacimonetes bacterium]|nr:hypothetical protein [Candidatus Cloacimonadota bacterium]
MAEKELQLKLKYKGKYLDTAKFKRDFRKRFYIGSDRHLFWQILDKTFPHRFLFLIRSKSIFKIRLAPTMDVNVRIEGQDLDKPELRKKNLLRGNLLTLDEDSNGQIKLTDEWEIEYIFLSPYRFQPAPEEVAILREFSQWPPLTYEQKFTRNFLLLGLLVTIIGLCLFEILYVPPPRLNFRERFKRIDVTATRVTPQYIEEEVPEVQINIAEEKAESEEIAKEAVEKAEKTAIAEFEEMFGERYDIGADFEGELFEMDVISEIVATGPVTSESVPLVSRGSQDRMSVLQEASDKSLNLSDLDKDLSQLEEISLGQDFQFEEVDISALSGEVKDFTVTKVKSKAQFEVVKRKFATLQTVKETSIELAELEPETKTEIANINQVVNAYKPQITKLYIVERMYMDMYGTLEFVLYIEENGKVVAVDITPIAGSFFTDSFLQKAEEIILKWKVPVKRAVPYSFRMKFIKQ